jgi:uncharacterized protein (TIGR03118 family)
MRNRAQGCRRAPRMAAWLASGMLALAGTALAQNAYVQHNLVSDLPGVAEHQDANLVNPWGITKPPTGPFWISDNGTGVSTLYNGAGQPVPLVVTIPPPMGGTPPAAPTGVVFNSTKQFQVGENAPALFIFVTEDGTVSGWNPTVSLTSAVLKVDNSTSGAIYKGAALGQVEGHPMLYATNFHAGTVDVFDGSFTPTTVSGGFVDSDLPEGYAPFGIRHIGDFLYVTYALQDEDKKDDVPGPGHGFVDVFSMEGRLEKRLISRGELNSPWGLAFAPGEFGKFSRALLVGNFGSGQIHGYNIQSGDLRGTLSRPDGEPVTILGLWGLDFGNGFVSDSKTLYFTAGIPGPDNIEDHGLFGSLAPARPDQRPE